MVVTQSTLSANAGPAKAMVCIRVRTPLSDQPRASNPSATVPERLLAMKATVYLWVRAGHSHHWFAFTVLAMPAAAHIPSCAEATVVQTVSQERIEMRSYGRISR